MKNHKKLQPERAWRRKITERRIDTTNLVLSQKDWSMSDNPKLGVDELADFFLEKFNTTLEELFPLKHLTAMKWLRIMWIIQALKEERVKC